MHFRHDEWLSKFVTNFRLQQWWLEGIQLQEMRNENGFMSNPATLPLLIMVGGIAWNALCAITASYLSKDRDFSTASSFWLRRAGWIGFALTTALAALRLFWCVSPDVP